MSQRAPRPAVRTAAGALTVALAASLLSLGAIVPAAAEPGEPDDLPDPVELGYVQSPQTWGRTGIWGPEVRIGHVTMQDRGDGVTRFTYIHTVDDEGPVTCGVYYSGEDTPREHQTIIAGARLMSFVIPVDTLVGYGGDVPLNDANTDPGRRWSFSHGNPAIEQHEEIWIDVEMPEGLSVHDLVDDPVFAWLNYRGGYHDNGNSALPADSCGRSVPGYIITDFVRTLNEADFRVDEVEGEPGSFVFTPQYASGQHTWDFGDGSTSTNPSPSHTYEVPGTFMVTHCRTVDVEECTSKPVVVAANELTAWVRLAHDDADDESGDFALGEEFSVRLGIEVGDDGVGGIEDITLEYSPEEFLANANLELVSAPEDPAWPEEPFALAPGESKIWDWRVTPARAGPLRVFNRVSAEDAAGRAVEPVEVEANGMVLGLLVELVFPEDPVVLELLELGEENSEAGFEPALVPVTVKVTVPVEADGGEPLVELELFRQNEADGYLDIDAVRRERTAGGFVWVDVQPQPLPFPVQVVSGPDPVQYAGPVQPGQSREFELVLEVDKPGNFELGAIVQGVTEEDRHLVSGRTAEVLNVGAQAVLALHLTASTNHGPNPSIEEGQRAFVWGTLTNLTEDSTIRLDPIQLINDGQGLVMGPVGREEALPAVGETTAFGPELAPGPEGVEEFLVAVATAQLPGVDSSLLTGRESIMLDTLGLTGVVIDAEGNERALDAATEVDYQVDAGRHTAEGHTWLRIEVEPASVELPTLSLPMFFLTLSASTTERFIQGAFDSFVQIPSVVAALPQAAWHLGEAGWSFTTGEVAAYSTAVRWLWAWADHYMDLHLGLDPSTNAAILDEVTDELWAAFGHQLDNRDQVADLVNGAVEGFFTRAMSWRDRAYDAAQYGFTLELAQTLAEPYGVAGQVVAEELTGRAIVSFLSKAARSLRAADDVQNHKVSGLLQDWLTLHVWDVVPLEGCHCAQEVPA